MHIYCVGVAGAGVSALASMLQSQGHTVSGSDEAAHPPISTYLDRIGVPFHNGFDAALLPAQVDVAIVGTSAKLGAENPEIAALQRRGTPCFSFAEFLGRHTAARRNIVVAGSFGKSTLTAMIAWLLRACGRDPGWFIGAVPLDLDRTGNWGGDAEMVIEGDEYVVSEQDRRSKFLLYEPAHLLISSLTHDHFNMFPSFESYQAPFRALLQRRARGGALVCARGYPALAEMVGRGEAIWYGLDVVPGQWGARVLALGERSRFAMVEPSGRSTEVETQLLGLHNIENLVGAVALIASLGLASVEALAAAAPQFRGVERRLDRKTTRSRVPIYEGFGSSLEKAQSALAAISLHFPHARRIVVFEPHAFSWRNRAALPWYDVAFNGASQVVLLPPPLHGADSHGQLRPEEIAARVNASGTPCLAVADAASAQMELHATLRPGDVVLLLSSGPLGGLAQSLPPWADAAFG